MQRSTPSTFRTGHARRPLHLMVATAVLALAGGLMQTAGAAPFAGGPGGPAAMSAIGGIGPMGGMAMAHPRQMDRLFDSVGVSAEQRAQIRQIFEAARTDLKAQREAGRALHEQARSLFTQPQVDARAAEALRQQIVAQHDQASKRGLQAMLEVSRVLTPEQRQAIAERIDERRGKMRQRHRGERERTRPTL